MSYLLKIAFAPGLFFLSVASGLFLVSQGAPLWTLGLVLLAAIALSFVSEQLIPYQRDWNESKGDRTRDLLHFIVNEGTIAYSTLLIPLFAAIVPGDGIWPSHWPLWAQLAIAIVVADCGITLAHYASHRGGILWRLHAVHHSVKRMYGFNGLMKHPLHQAVEITAGTTPLILAGMPVEIAALLSLAVATQLLLQHSNVDMKIGPLRLIWAVAPVHRFHHLNKSGEGDVNFGLFLTVWDRILGTAYFDRSRTIVSEEIGIEGEPDYPVNYLRQLLEPFRSVTAQD